MSQSDPESSESGAAGELADNVPIRAQGTLTVENWVEAYRLAFALNWKGIGAVALAIGCIVLPNALRLPNRMEAALVVGLLTCFGAVVCGIGSAFDRRRAHRHFQHYKPMACEILITEEHIEHRLETSTERFAWSTFSEYGRSDQLLVLVQSKLLRTGLQVFPRELFESSAEWDRFIALVERKLPRR